MSGLKIRFAAALLIAGAMSMTGCKSKPAQNADGTVTNPNGSVTVPAQAAPQAAATNGTPAGAQAPPQQMAIRNQDGSVTNPDGSVTYPSGSRVAERENSPNGSGSSPQSASVPAPVERTSVGSNTAPATTYAPAPVVRSIPAGTTVSVRTNGTLSAHENNVGDRFTGTLARALVYHGETVFAAGTPVSGEVVASKGKGRFKGAGDLGIELTAIGRDRVESSEYEKVGKGRGKRSAAFTGGGAGLGALIGGLAGGGKGALIGGLAGAGGGAAAGSYTGSTDVVIPAESVISFTLRTALSR